MIRAGALTAIVAGLMFSPVSSQAQTEDEAKWQVCNETSFVLRVSVAYQLRGRLVSRGWLRFRPGECAPVEVPANEPRFIYAESSSAYHGGIREWKGTKPLCTESAEFTSDPADACKLGDAETRMFIAVNPKDPVTTLAEPEDYGRRAEVAGLQRLLKDNGYKVSRIDGVSGRRTTRNLSAFVKAKKLAANLSTVKKIDALEEAAQERLKTIGLTVCNRSSNEVWTAIGRRNQDNWESRGWWTLPVSECMQLVQEPLSGLDMHLFARQKHKNEDGTGETDKSLRSVSANPETFCITEARFSALGREDCGSNGYIAADFRPVISEGAGTTINLTDADFVEISLPGLRR